MAGYGMEMKKDVPLMLGDAAASMSPEANY